MPQLAARRRDESTTESRATSQADAEEKSGVQQRWKWQPPDAKRVSEGSAEGVSWDVAKGLSDRPAEEQKERQAAILAALSVDERVKWSGGLQGLTEEEMAGDSSDEEAEGGWWAKAQEKGQAGKGDLFSDISQENDSKIAAMSPEEIEEARAALMHTLPEAIRNKWAAGKANWGDTKSMQPKQLPGKRAPPAEERKSEPFRTGTELEASIQKTAEDLEKSKLEWTTSLPELPESKEKEAADKAEPFHGRPFLGESVAEDLLTPQVRYDLQGRIIPKVTGASISTSEGLHHHGDRPSEAGYNLQELFMLAQSKHPAQRASALSALAHAIRFNAAAEDKGVLPAGEGGLGMAPVGARLHWAAMRADLSYMKVATLLRFSMDDANISVLTPALLAAKSLIQADMRIADDGNACSLGSGVDTDKVEPFHLSQMVWLEWGKPVLQAYQRAPEEGDEEEPYECDEDIAEQDLVSGWLRMGLLPRLRYVLEVHRSPSFAVPILEILITIARHSKWAAGEVWRCPRLVAVIRQCFIEVSPDGTPTIAASRCDQFPYGWPHSLAVRLVRCLMQSSRAIAEELHRSGFAEAIQRHILTPAKDMEAGTSGDPNAVGRLALVADSLGLTREVLLSWQCFGWYGLGNDSILDLYPLLHTALHTDSAPAGAVSGFSQRPVARLPSGMQGLAATPSNAVATLGLFEIAAAAGAHGSMEAVVEAATMCLTHASHAAGRGEGEAGIGFLAQVAASLKLMVSFYETLPEEAVDMGMMETMEADWGGPLSAVCSAEWFSRVVGNTIAGLREGILPSEDGPAWWCIYGSFDACRILLERHRGVHKASSTLGLETVLLKAVSLLEAYLGRVAEFHAVDYRHRHPATLAVVAALRLARLIDSLQSPTAGGGKLEVRAGLLYESGLFIVPCLGPSDECLADILLDTVLLHPEYMNAALQAKVESPRINADQIRSLHLPLLQNRLSNTVSGPLSLAVSSGMGTQLTGMFLPPNRAALPVGPEWLYTSLNKNQTGTSDPATVYTAIALLDAVRESVARYAYGVSPDVSYRCLCSVFLAEESPYLEPETAGQLDRLLSVCESEVSIIAEDEPLADRMLEAFVNESFGSAVFGRAMAVYLSPKAHSEVRFKLWRECSQSRLLPVVAASGTRISFSSPSDQDDDCIREYADSIEAEAVGRKTGEALYRACLEHIAASLERRAQDGTREAGVLAAGYFKRSSAQEDLLAALAARAGAGS